MKRFYLSLFAVAFCVTSTLPVIAECDCTGSQIITKIKNTTRLDQEDLFATLIDNSAFSPSYKTESAFAEIIYEARNETYFQKALKDYINNNCSVSNNKIYCN